MFDQDPPATIEVAEGVIDFAKEREIRLLRARVAELEQRDRERERVITEEMKVPALLSVNPLAEIHRDVSCGFHPQVLVSSTTPLVYCKVCLQELDALEVLRYYSKKERQFMYMNESLQKKRKELLAEVEQLKRDVANLKAQKRRAKEPTTP